MCDWINVKKTTLTLNFLFEYVFYSNYYFTKIIIKLIKETFYFTLVQHL